MGKVTIKDRLPWGFLLTYLFDDHRLVDVDSLYKLHSDVQARNKKTVTQEPAQSENM